MELICSRLNAAQSARPQVVFLHRIIIMVPEVSNAFFEWLARQVRPHGNYDFLDDIDHPISLASWLAVMSGLIAEVPQPPPLAQLCRRGGEIGRGSPVACLARLLALWVESPVRKPWDDMPRFLAEGGNITI